MPIVSRDLYVADEGKFERRYLSLLEVSDSIAERESVIVLDDVATRGSTLQCMIRALRKVNPGLKILAVTAGQMVLMSTCRELP